MAPSLLGRQEPREGVFALRSGCELCQRGVSRSRGTAAQHGKFAFLLWNGPGRPVTELDQSRLRSVTILLTKKDADTDILPES